MQERIIFREMLSGIKELADAKGNCLTSEEVRDFFSNAHLTEEQFAMIFAYLEGQKIQIEGYEPAGGKAEPEEQEGKDPTEDEYMKMYLEDLETVLPVSEEEEEKLFLLAAAGDAGAKSRLTEFYLKMVCEIAHTYAYGSLPVSDLIQEGNIALLLALNDLEVQESLQEYREELYRAVSRAMEEALTEQRDLKDLDEQVAERVNHLSESVKNLERDLEHRVSVSELSAYLEMPMEEIRDILRMAGDEIKIRGE